MLHACTVHNPAYNGTDPFFPKIVIDDECLARLPGNVPGDEPADVDWSGLVLEAAVANPQYAGVPAATVGTGATTDEPSAQSGLGRDEDPPVDQDELLRRILDCAASGDSTIEWPSIGEDVSEFTCLNYLAAAFPHLFPLGGCQFLGERLWQPSPGEWFCHLLRLRGGRFARDARFRYLAHDTIARHRNISTAGAFVAKQYAGRTLAQLRAEIESGSTKSADALSRFVNHIPGNRAYWKKQSNFLQSFDFFLQTTYDQTFTVFYTLSHADLHCPDLHKMLHDLDASTTVAYLNDDGSPRDDITSAADYRARRNALITNPHVVGHHFVTRSTEFVETVLTPILNLKDVARRFEMQARGITHEHGLGRCGHGPTIPDLLLVVLAVSKLTANDHNDRPSEAEINAVTRVLDWIQENIPMTAEWPGTPDQIGVGAADAPLRRMFGDLRNVELDENSTAFATDQRGLSNRCMIHHCSIDDCKKQRRKDCICHGVATVTCHACRPPCKKGFDDNDPCQCGCRRRGCTECQPRPADDPPRMGRNNDRVPCGCQPYVYFNYRGNRVEFSAPRTERSLHVRVPIFLQAWRANMDIRFCLDVSAVQLSSIQLNWMMLDDAIEHHGALWHFACFSLRPDQSSQTVHHEVCNEGGENVAAFLLCNE